MDWLIDLYLRELSKIRDPKTIKTKRSILEHLDTFSDGNLIDLDRSGIIEFREYLLSKGLKESTIRQILREVKYFYRWASGRGYNVSFDEEAVKDIYRSQRLRAKKKRKYYTDSEIELILDAIRGIKVLSRPSNPVFYLLTTFLLSSGLRLSEAVNVKKRDITIKEILTDSGELLNVWIVKVREGKFGKEREAVIRFWKDTWEIAWEKWLSKLEPDDYIFTYTIKYPKSTKTLVLKPNTAQRFYWELEKKLRRYGYDIEINAHRFRNTYITKMASRGVPVNLIADWVGHEKISTTMDVYMEAEREKALEVVIGRL